MKRRTIGIAIFALIAVLLMVAPVFAYIYRATYTVTSNSTTAYEMLGVSTDNAISNQWMADNGYFNSTANDTRIETLGGLEQPHMVTEDATFTAIPVPVNSQTNLYFTTGNSEQDFDIIPGYGGSVNVTDASNLELSANFTTEQSGWVDTASGANKNLIYKPGAFRTYVSGTGNITSGISFIDNFDADAWTDVGVPDIYVDTANSRLHFYAQREVADERSYRQLYSSAGNVWSVDFDFRYTAESHGAGNRGMFWFGLFSAAENPNGAAGKLIAFVLWWNNGDGSVQSELYTSDGNVDILTNLTINTTYYVTLERTSAIEAKLSVFTDAGRTTHLANSPVTKALTTVGDLAYVQASNLNAADASWNVTGWIDSLEIEGALLSVTATGVSSGEYIVTTTANITHMWIDIDGATQDTATLGGVSVPNNANVWVLQQNNVMPYSGNASITVNGTLQLWFQPNDIITGTNLPDRATSVATNNGTFIWGANPTGVLVAMGGLVSEAQPSPGLVIDDPTPDIMPGVEVTDWYIEPDVTGALLANPIRPFVIIMSDTTTLTELQAWRLLGTALLLSLIVATAKTVRGHQGITAIAAGAGILGLVVWTIYPMWALVVGSVMFIGGLIAERSPSL